MTTNPLSSSQIPEDMDPGDQFQPIELPGDDALTAPAEEIISDGSMTDEMGTIEDTTGAEDGQSAQQNPPASGGSQPPGGGKCPPIINELFPTPPTGGPQPSLLNSVLNRIFAPNFLAGFVRFFALVIYPLLVIVYLNSKDIHLFTRQNWPLILMFILPFLLAFEISALYIQMLYGLQSKWMAYRVLLANAFGLTIEKVRVDNGNMPAALRSRIMQVGGPGLLQVNFDTAALVERPNGQPYFVRQTTPPLFRIPGLNVIPIQGFNRVRAAIDLRDHIMEWSTKARTKDGIQISASNLQIIFSVRRAQIRRSSSNRLSPILQNKSYNFHKWALYRLSYSQQLNNGTLANVIQPIIRTEFRNFIASRTLRQILSSVRASDLQNINQNILLRHFSSGPLPVTTPRTVISGVFTEFTRKFNRETYGAGIQIEWINIGVWQLDATGILQQHVQAWEQDIQNSNATSGIALARLTQDAANNYTRALLQEIVKTFTLAYKNGQPRKAIIHKLLRDYYGKFVRARGVFTDPQELQDLNNAITIINNRLRIMTEQAGGRFLDGSN